MKKNIFKVLLVCLALICGSISYTYATQVKTEDLCQSAGNVDARIVTNGYKFVKLTNGNNYPVSVSWEVRAKNVSSGEVELIGSSSTYLKAKGSDTSQLYIDPANYCNYQIHIDVSKCD